MLMQPHRQRAPRSARFSPASALEPNVCSREIEDFVHRRLAEDRLARAHAEGRTLDETPGAEGLFLRMVHSDDTQHGAAESLRELHPEFPKSFPYRSKTLVLFQSLDGVDVVLFVAFMHEYGSDAPQPNTRRINVSYIEAVTSLFSPDIASATKGVKLRSIAFKAVLQGYLAYAQRRGFLSASIWACPPMKNVDYILHMRPAHERSKQPNNDILCDWYESMLAVARDVDLSVESFGPLLDLLRPANCGELPYFKDDVWTQAWREHGVLKLRQARHPVVAAAVDAEVLAMLRDPSQVASSWFVKCVFLVKFRERAGGFVADPDALMGGVDCVLRDRDDFLKWCEANSLHFSSLRRARQTTVALLSRLHEPDAGQVPGEAAPEPPNAELLSPSQLAQEQMKVVVGPGGLLEHASVCADARTCTSRRCPIVKAVFERALSCAAPETDPACQRLLELLRIHAHACRAAHHSCPVPLCDELRGERTRAEAAATAARAESFVAT